MSLSATELWLVLWQYMARLMYEVSVSGWSTPRTLSYTNTALCWKLRAIAASPTM